MRLIRLSQLGLFVLATLLALIAVPAARAGTPTPTYFLGDVNCDDAVDSIDAALVLQVEAALFAGLPCANNADMNGDRISNTADATLVLQYTARLIKSRVQFSLNVTRPAGLCDDAEKPTVCNVPAGTEFGLSIALNHPPPEGYITFATELYYGDLRYNPTTAVNEEIAWPDSGLPVRYLESPSTVAHGSLSSVQPPFPESHFRGSLVALSMTCPNRTGTFNVALLAFDASTDPLGSLVNLPTMVPEIWNADTLVTGRRNIDRDGSGAIDSPDEMNVGVAATLQINCVAP